MRYWRHSSRLTLASILLILLVVSGCAGRGHGLPAYKPVMPVLTLEQVESCTLEWPDGHHEVARCVRLLFDEYRRLVIEYKAMCLALGWGTIYCQTDRSINLPAGPSVAPQTPGVG